MILSLLLYTWLFLLPWQTRWLIKLGELNGYWEYGTISLYGTDILVLIAFLIFFFWTKKKKIKPARSHLNYRLFIIFLSYLLLTLPFSLAPLLSFVKLLTFIIVILVVYLSRQSQLSFRTSTLAFLGGATTSSLLGLWQFVTQQSFVSKWLGLAEHNANMLGTSVVEAMAPDGIMERWLRGYGTLDHPNMLGGFLALSLILASWLWLSRDHTTRKLENWFLVISLIILSAGVLVSFSRTAWLVAVVGVGIVVWGYIKEKKLNRWREVSSLLGMMVLVITLFLSQYYYIVWPRFNPSLRLEAISVTEREDSLKTSWQIFKNHPLLGTGIGTYTKALAELEPKKQNWYYQPVHNTFLLLLVETGVFGFLLFLWAIKRLWRSLVKNISAFQKSLILSLGLGLLLISLFDHWLWSLHFGLMMMGAIIVLLIQLRTRPSLTD